jgi:hypothetical protein
MNHTINISLHEEGFCSWHTQALALFKEKKMKNND